MSEHQRGVRFVRRLGWAGTCIILWTSCTLRPGPRTGNVLGHAANGAVATSFITSEVLGRWLSRHPVWRVILDGDESVPGMALIEVPELSIAGFTVGPVWFTERPDANFHEHRSKWMDRKVDGAPGGNVFRFFPITRDYPADLAHFVRVDGSG